MSVAADAMRRRSLDTAAIIASIPLVDRGTILPRLAAEGRRVGSHDVVGYNHRSHGEYPIGQEACARLVEEARSESLDPLSGQDAGFPRAAPGRARRGQYDQRRGPPGDQRPRQSRRERRAPCQQCLAPQVTADERAGQADGAAASPGQGDREAVWFQAGRILGKRHGKEGGDQARESESVASSAATVRPELLWPRGARLTFRGEPQTMSA